jgi:Zn-dependent protease
VIPRVTSQFPNFNEISILLIALLHAVAIYVSVFVHELGHAFSAQKYGYQPKEIVLNLIGGHTAFSREFDTPKHQIVIALLGPVANSLVIVIGAVLYVANIHPVINSVSTWLMWASAITTIVNLLPGFPLDGGAILGGIVWSLTKDRSKGARANAIGGISIAGIWFLSPWILEATIGWTVTFSDVIISSLIGSWLLLSSIRMLALTRIEEQIEGTAISESKVLVRSLTRRAVLVDSDTDLQGALEAMRKDSAGAIIVMDTKPIGIVRELVYSSDEHGAVRSFARRIDQFDLLRADMSIDECMEQLNNLSASEWLVVDEEDRIFGVLMRSDVEGYS